MSALGAILHGSVLLVGLVAAPPAFADSALATVARQVAHDLGSVPRALVVASPHTVVAPRGDELASRLAALVAAALAGDAHSTESPLPLAPARVRAGAAKAGTLVYLDVRVDAGELRLTADAYPVIANAWDRIRSPPPPPASHAYVIAPVTAEVRSYLPPIHLESARLTRARQDVGDVLALACGDVDGDGANDLVLVTRHAVVLGHLDSGRFVVVRRVTASSIGSRAPVPFREPFATAIIAKGDGHGSLYVAWGDRMGAVLGPDLVPHGALVGFPVWDGAAGVGCALPDAARGGFADTIVGCADGKPRDPADRGPSRALDAWSALDMGSGARLVAAHEPLGSLHLTVGGESVVENDKGAQLALADFDEDGAPEVVTTLARGEDALIVSTFRSGTSSPRLRWAAPAGVGAVAVCPPEGMRAPTLVAAVGSEIWHVD